MNSRMMFKVPSSSVVFISSLVFPLVKVYGGIVFIIWHLPMSCLHTRTLVILRISITLIMTNVM